MAMNREQKRMLQKQGEVDSDGEPVRKRRDAPTRQAPTQVKESRLFSRQFMHEVRAELRKVAWPTRSETINYSIIVLVALVVHDHVHLRHRLGLQPGRPEAVQRVSTMTDDSSTPEDQDPMHQQLVADELDDAVEADEPRPRPRRSSTSSSRPPSKARSRPRRSRR